MVGADLRVRFCLYVIVILYGGFLGPFSIGLMPGGLSK